MKAELADRGTEHTETKIFAQMIPPARLHAVLQSPSASPLTAVNVARQVEIVDREALILDAPPENDDSGTKLVWRSINEKISIPVGPSKDLDRNILQSKGYLRYGICSC